MGGNALGEYIQMPDFKEENQIIPDWDYQLSEINEKLDRLLKCFEHSHCKSCPEKLRCLTKKKEKKND